ncbi:MAG: hypothetical protein ABW199_05820 [Caulobacterales bacterium]
MAAAPHGAEHAAEAAHGGGVFPPFDASTFAHQLVWFAITFGALYLILSRVALPKVQAVLDNRAATLKRDIDAAAQQSAAAEAARADMEKSIADARTQSRKMIDDMRASAQAELSAEAAKSEQALAAQAAAAETRIRDMRTAALAQVSSVADDLARDIVGRLAPGAR